LSEPTAQASPTKQNWPPPRMGRRGWHDGARAV